MLLTLKRTLTISFVAAVAVLPAVSAHQAAHAATVTSAAAAGPAAAAGTAASAAGAAAGNAAATRRHHRRSRRMRAYIWAAHQRGKPYCWAGQAAASTAPAWSWLLTGMPGIHLARDTTEMLASSRLVRVHRRHAKKGDLAFYGTGHVELVAGRRYTLGALHTGTLIGWHRVSQWWRPTMYFRIRAGRLAARPCPAGPRRAAPGRPCAFQSRAARSARNGVPPGGM